MFALDTNTVIDFFRGRGRVADRLLAVRPSEIGLPAISAYEARVGVLGSRSKRGQTALSSGLTVQACSNRDLGRPDWRMMD